MTQHEAYNLAGESEKYLPQQKMPDPAQVVFFRLASRQYGIKRFRGIGTKHTY
jgi:hypothetical protein